MTFTNPPGVPTGHLPDTGGILVSTSHNFQEAGVHAEAIWAPSTHIGFVQGHFHHLENGFETMHGFGDADAEGWHDVQGFYVQMVDGSPFSLRSIDFRLRLNLQTARILVTTHLDPSQPFGGQFVEFPVGRFSTFRTQNFADFENVTQVFISAFLVDNNTEQIQFDNIVVWTEPPIVGACCRAEGVLCDLLTVEDCAAGGGAYLGDKSVCTDGAFCPTRTGACCSPDAVLCEIRPPVACVLPDGVFSGLGTGCGIEVKCPAATGACCVDNGAACLEVLRPVCIGPDTFFQGEGTQCIAGADCPVPCDSDADCDDGNVCNGSEICNLVTGECGPGTRLDCDDNDACTLDRCDSLLGCFTDPRGCDDADPCTVDTCEAELGCKNVPITCDDGDVCNGVATCNPETGSCQPGTPPDCDDGNACTIDECDPVTGCFRHPRDCDDGDGCTTDACDPVLGCQNVPIPCEDGDVCNGVATCNPKTGECQPGTPLDCDDGDACTIDECNPLTGCFSNPRGCDDGDPCTVDTCEAALGCKNVRVTCDDGNVCNGLDTCNPETGECQPGIFLDCDDGDACTTDECDALTGCFHEVRNCDDGDPCTREECDPQAGCLNLPICPPGWACLAGECSCFQPAGDYDGDGHLDLGDFAHAVNCLGGPGGGLLPNCDCADLNADGDIDLFDLADYLNGVDVP